MLVTSLSLLTYRYCCTPERMSALRKSIIKQWPVLAVTLMLFAVVLLRTQSANTLGHELKLAVNVDEDVNQPKLRPLVGKDNSVDVGEEEVSQDTLKCPSPPFRLLSGKGSVIQLASFPGSGNTWIRHLIQRGSGALTGSVYDDKSLYVEFPAEGVRDPTVIAVKTHYPCEACWNVGPEKKIPARESQTGILKDYRATIQVLRSPFGAMLSDFNHKRSGANHTGFASKEEFESSVFDDFVLLRMKIWTRHATYYLANKGDGVNGNFWTDIRGKPVLLIYYEDLKKDTVGEMTKIFEFIKRFSPKDSFLSTMDSVRAAKCSIAQDAVGGFRRSPLRTKPFEKKLPGGKTAREVVCDYVHDKAAEFWKKNDSEWDCA